MLLSEHHEYLLAHDDAAISAIRGCLVEPESLHGYDFLSHVFGYLLREGLRMPILI